MDDCDKNIKMKPRNDDLDVQPELQELLQKPSNLALLPDRIKPTSKFNNYLKHFRKTNLTSK